MKITIFFAAFSVLCMAGTPNMRAADAVPQTGNAIALFDGQTLNGWIDQENSAGNLGGGDIKNFESFAKKLSGKSGAVSEFLNNKFDETLNADLASYSAANTNAKAVRSALVRALNKIISGAPIYDDARFKDVQLSPETKQLLAKNPKGLDLARLNKMLIEDAYPMEITKSPTAGWIVKDGAIASTGAGRGTLYTTGDYGHFRLTFLMRHVSGKPDHQACVLIFCTRPKENEKPLDALGGIQFQVPNGGHWDYRPGHNNGGGDEFTTVNKTKFNIHEWSQVEIVADAKTGMAKMAVAQPPGTNAVEVLDFNDPVAGKVGPIALQMHNGGLFDEYKDIRIEVNPATDDFISVK